MAGLDMCGLNIERALLILSTFLLNIKAVKWKKRIFVWLINFFWKEWDVGASRVSSSCLAVISLRSSGIRIIRFTLTGCFLLLCLLTPSEVKLLLLLICVKTQVCHWQWVKCYLEMVHCNQGVKTERWTTRLSFWYVCTVKKDLLRITTGKKNEKK